MRTRAERRHNDKKKALRKRYITRNAYYSYSIDMQEYYDNLHQYSKNKIHCSCPMCAQKLIIVVAINIMVKVVKIGNILTLLKLID